MDKGLSKKACRYLAEKIGNAEKNIKEEIELKRDSLSNSSFKTLDQSRLKYRSISRELLQSLSCSKKKNNEELRNRTVGEGSLRLPDRYEDALKIYSKDRRSYSNNHKTLFYKGLTFDRRPKKQQIDPAAYSGLLGTSQEGQTSSFSSSINAIMQDSRNLKRQLFE